MKKDLQQRKADALRRTSVAIARCTKASSTWEIGKANKWALAWNREYETLVASYIELNPETRGALGSGLDMPLVVVGMTARWTQCRVSDWQFQ